MRQPWAGWLAAATATVFAILGWEFLAVRLETKAVYALLSYAEFWLFTLGWFYHNAPAGGLRQPAKGFVLTGLAAALGALAYLLIGAIPQMYIFFVPQFLFFFFGDWPVPSSRPWLKGTFWAGLIWPFEERSNRHDQATCG
jgi:hypothetical protein